MKHRLFIAIAVPTSLYLDITRLQSRIRSLGSLFQIEPKQKLHLTLNFLGRIDEQFNARLEGDINGVSKRCVPFSLIPQFLETLYRRHEPSIVYLGVGGDVIQLTDLQHSLNESMARLTLPQQNRFLPHIKLGELDRTDPVTTKNFLDKVSQIEFEPLEPFLVDHFTLYESFPSRNGTHFQKVRDYYLRSV